MSGIVTDKRVIDPGGYTFWTRFALGSYLKNTGYTPPERQETTSFRTRGGADSEDQEIKDARRIFRNGMTSYDPVYDHGHEFFTTRTEIKTSHPYWEGWRTNTGQNYYSGYKGPLWTTSLPGFAIAESEYPVVRRLSASDIRSYGSRAISATIPTAPQASLSTLLGEVILDGGLPYAGTAIKGAPSSRDNILKDVGSDWLNANFGWLPVVSDVKKLISSLKGANATIKQLARDSGKNVRRGFSFPLITTHTTSTSQRGGFESPWMNVHPDLVRVTDPTGLWQLETSLQTTTQIRFRGCFTYHLRSNSDLLGKLEHYEQLGNKLLGTRLNAEALWELAPWSWLIDWQSTIGVALGNASKLSEDGLVLRYGYLMSHNKDVRTYTARGISFHGGTIGHTSTQLRRESKERVRATPFGFGLDLSSLTAKQWSILAALGMTKGSNSLRLTS